MKYKINKNESLNINFLWESHKRFFKSNSFLNNQNYVLTDMWRYEYYDAFLKKKVNPKLYIIIELVIFFLALIFSQTLLIVYIRVLLLFILFYSIYQKTKEFFGKDFLIILYKKILSKRKNNFFIFKTKVWLNNKYNFFSYKK